MQVLKSLAVSGQEKRRRGGFCLLIGVQTGEISYTFYGKEVKEIFLDSKDAKYRRKKRFLPIWVRWGLQSSKEKCTVASQKLRNL